MSNMLIIVALILFILLEKTIRKRSKNSGIPSCQTQKDDTAIDQTIRHGLRSTIATSQLPIDEWHAVIGDRTLADVIPDRLVHNACKINLRGEESRCENAKQSSQASPIPGNNKTLRRYAPMGGSFAPVRVAGFSSICSQSEK